MIITLQLNAEVERKLQEEAARNGLTVEAYIQRLVEQTVAPRPIVAKLPPEEWAAEFRAWVASHKPLPHIADDDRESIYAGRGE
ncbi:MAG TPA: hypothetical protein DDY78_09250 [Planctomycetales bacterium]|jgi:hypothetical protein|nr:hypothetical protein [Planctomycetales bacterium]